MRRIINELVLAWRLIRDPRVPGWVKILPFVPLVYLVVPFDLIPDFILVLGQVDDISLLFAGVYLLKSLSPPDVVEELDPRLQAGRKRGDADVIESTEYSIREEDDPAR